MTNGLATIQNNAMVLDAEKVELLSKTIANGAPPLEFEMFVGVCNRTGLDPFAKQIYFIQRGGRWSWQTGIDGYRLIADRTGKYAGSDDPEFVGDPDGGQHPVTATVTVYKMLEGQRCPFTATARWSEYYPGDKGGQMWAKMPYLMLGKCAEALALRKAFPAELSGLYTREEMAQADADYVDVGGATVVQATGEIIDVPAETQPTTPEYERWVPLIQTAETLDDLQEIGEGLKEAGISGDNHPGIAKEYRKHQNRLKIDAASANKVA